MRASSTDGNEKHPHIEESSQFRTKGQILKATSAWAKIWRNETHQKNETHQPPKKKKIGTGAGHSPELLSAEHLRCWPEFSCLLVWGAGLAGLRRAGC